MQTKIKTSFTMNGPIARVHHASDLQNCKCILKFIQHIESESEQVVTSSVTRKVVYG